MSNELTSVTGLRVKKFTSTEGSEDKAGKIQIVLEASKDDVRVGGDGVGDYNFGDIVAALNIHQTASEPIIMELRFQEE